MKTETLSQKYLRKLVRADFLPAEHVGWVQGSGGKMLTAQDFKSGRQLMKRFWLGATALIIVAGLVLVYVVVLQLTDSPDSSTVKGQQASPALQALSTLATVFYIMLLPYFIASLRWMIRNK